MNNVKVERYLIHYSRTAMSAVLASMPHAGELDWAYRLIAQLDPDESNTPIAIHDARDHLVIPPDWPNERTPLEVSLSSPTLSTLRKVAVLLVRSCVTSTAPERPAVKALCDIVWPLYSRDPSTTEIGFDLQEFADFYDDMPTLEERLRFAEDQVGRWVTAWDLDEETASILHHGAASR